MLRQVYLISLPAQNTQTNYLCQFGTLCPDLTAEAFAVVSLPLFPRPPYVPGTRVRPRACALNPYCPQASVAAIPDCLAPDSWLSLQHLLGRVPE